MQAVVEAEKILRESNTIISGDHFVYISGHHGDGWVNKDAILPDTRKISRLAFLITEKLKDLKIDIVCGPAIGDKSSQHPPIARAAMWMPRGWECPNSYI